VTTTEALTEVLRAACAQVGLDSSEATPLREHANAVFLLPASALVARLSRNPSDQVHASTTVALTRWLVSQEFPAPAPADVEQPVNVSGYVVTFWRYYPQGKQSPGTADLGLMLRQLHSLPKPPVLLDAYRPLHSLGRTVEASTGLSDADRHWLLDRQGNLLEAYGRLEFPLGVGLIHGDAYPGNTLWDGSRALLGDWDEAGTGPRELDLVNTHQGARFGRSREDRDAFNRAYGYDITAWPGFPVLREMRDIHTLGSFIRLADRGNEKAASELAFRLDTLRRGDADARWNAR
jgi:aminoglycoside phosphotransferase (APT) family kinase protein